MSRIEQTTRRSAMYLSAILAIFLASAMPFAHSQTAKTTPATTQATANLLDINTASTADLKALPGIGDAYAQRVIAGRPYTAKNQLVQRGIIPQATYDKISARIIAHRPK